ncbi:MAG: sulfatase [Verrucomicrobiales bacterium]|nr:sulfatase [Verrucomicrobiales bacterium]
MPRVSRIVSYGVLLGFALSCGFFAKAAVQPESRPNIVFILADDLGVFDLACYGRTEHPTPHLDRLAREGTRFTSAYCAQPICSASRAALMTGKSPARLHLTTYLPGRADCRSQLVLHPAIEPQLRLAEVTVAEALRSAGYATACIGKWHLGGAGFGPGDQGFDVVHPGKANTTPSEVEGGKGEWDLTSAAERFVETHRDQPFFLLLSHNSPHIPYAECPERVAARKGAFEPNYAAVIESLDATVGRLMSTLDRLGLADRTLVVFTSDNGGLHVPELRHERVTHNGPFRAGKGYLYEGGLRIPLIARWPGQIPAHRVTDVPFLNTDWLPTLLELCGLRNPDRIDGRSRAQFLLDRSRGPQGDLCWHFPHYTNQGGRPSGAVRSGRWKYVEFYDTGEVELYDLASDFGETRNLARDQARRVRRMRETLARWRTDMGAQANSPNPAAEVAAFRRLYVEFDPSQFRPFEATTEDWGRVAAWRAAMDAAVAVPGSN